MDILEEILVAAEVELLTSFLENVCHVCSRVDLDRCPAQVSGDDGNVRRHDPMQVFLVLVSFF